VNDILVIALFAIVAALLLYWFWPGPALCTKCKSKLEEFGYCSNLACSYSARQQPFESDKKNVRA
jgi:hypothetical protein